jgi:hypothetical protein
MPTTTRRKRHEMCEDIVDLIVGDVLVWDNTGGNHDCTVSGCMPALEFDSYTILMGTTTDANVVQKSKQRYHCECNSIRNDPKLIVN